MMDESQFLTLIATNQGILHKICRLYRDTKEDRQDLFQEIVFQLWKSAPNFKGEAKESTWLYRVALNTAIAAFRKKTPDIRFGQAYPDIPDDMVNEAHSERQARLFAALKLLNDGEKAVIALYLEDMSYQQIAEVAGLSENNVGVKLNRIKNKIQKLLNLGYGTG
jgi:RNA polymerase sigma factor (sigma-70 family)